MTLAELHERIGWQLKGTLEWRDGCGKWNQWREWQGVPSLTSSASDYRERPQPTLPDEVWIVDNGRVFSETRIAYLKHTNADGNDGKPIRYIRADGLIDGRKLQARLSRGSGTWYDCPGCEYRFRQ